MCFLLFTRSELSDEKHLIHDLLEKYERLGRDGRPVKNVSHPVKVEFGLGLIKMELHEKENVLALSTWARYVSPNCFGANGECEEQCSQWLESK